MVSILSDNFIDFNFPKPVKLEKVMRDFLEESVDEKYYIKNEKAQKLIKDLIANGTLRTEQNRTEQNSLPYDSHLVNNRNGERQSKISSSLSSNRLCKYPSCKRLQGAGKLCENECRYREPVLLSNQGESFESKTDIATCLMARDYKGFGNQVSNGVIEKWN
jgi:DNA (cytosine-5)-methyltransferase 1